MGVSQHNEFVEWIVRSPTRRALARKCAAERVDLPRKRERERTAGALTIASLLCGPGIVKRKRRAFARRFVSMDARVIPDPVGDRRRAMTAGQSRRLSEATGTAAAPARVSLRLSISLR